MDTNDTNSTNYDTEVFEDYSDNNYNNNDIEMVDYTDNTTEMSRPMIEDDDPNSFETNNTPNNDSGDGVDENCYERISSMYSDLLKNLATRHSTDKRGNQSATSDGIANVTKKYLLEHDSVLFALPSILVNVNEDAAHDTIPNVYVVPRKHLELLNRYVVAIEMDFSNSHNLDVFCRLMDEVQELELSDDFARLPLQYVMHVIQMITDRELEGDFVNVANDTICFDMIRKYECDELGLLIRAWPITEPINGNVYFYSQLADKRYADLRLNIKQSCNETVYNQMQYIVQRFTDTLLFRPGRQVRFSSKIANICVFFILISKLGKPVLDHAFLSIYDNLVGFLVDCIVRTRVITNWQKYPSTRQLLSEIVTNYHKEHEIVNICRMQDCRERIDYLLTKMKTNSNELKKRKFAFSYADYRSLLQKQIVLVRETEQFYFFDYNFIVGFLDNEAVRKLTDHMLPPNLLSRTENVAS